MVDFSGVSQSLAARITKIMAGDGNDAQKIDSRNEYNQLSELLSGKGKVTGDEKTFVKEMMSDYIEEFEVRSNIKKAVLDYIKNGNALQADNNTEIKDLKALLKTDGLTKEEKQWIREIINGRIVKTTTPEQNKTPEEPVVPDPSGETKPEEPAVPNPSDGTKPEEPAVPDPSGETKPKKPKDPVNGEDDSYIEPSFPGKELSIGTPQKPKPNFIWNGPLGKQKFK